MNYLIHIFLSGKEGKIQVGNFIGDSVKGQAYNQYPSLIKKGIILHREIDYFSDTHPIVKEVSQLFKPVAGRYSGIVTDMIFDYFLASEFKKYTGLSLSLFTYRFYGNLIGNYKYLPDRIKSFLWHLILTNRLKKYAKLKGIENSLDIMVMYKNLQIEPREVIQLLQENENELRLKFEVFFPDLQKFCIGKLAQK